MRDTQNRPQAIEYDKFDSLKTEDLTLMSSKIKPALPNHPNSSQSRPKKSKFSKA